MMRQNRKPAHRPRDDPRESENGQGVEMGQTPVGRRRSDCNDDTPVQSQSHRDVDQAMRAAG